MTLGYSAPASIIAFRRLRSFWNYRFEEANQEQRGQPEDAARVGYIPFDREAARSSSPPADSGRSAAWSPTM